MNIAVWPPTNLVPLMYTLLDLFSMVTDSAERCSNCHAADHSSGCPLFPTTVELDPAMGIPPPRTPRARGPSPTRRVSFQGSPRTRSPAPRQRSKKGQSGNSPKGPPPPPPPPPPTTPPPAKCRYGKNCQNRRNGCLYLMDDVNVPALHFGLYSRMDMGLSEDGTGHGNTPVG